MKRDPERGSAMLVTLIIVAALLAGAAVLVSMQLSSNRSSELTRNGTASLYCAEAGLNAARTTVGANADLWAGNLGTGTEPSFLSAVGHDLDGDNVSDFMITLEDDDDEMTGTNNKTTDINNKIFIVSKCTQYPDTPKTVKELIEYTPQPVCYPGQEGGCNGRGNANVR